MAHIGSLGISKDLQILARSGCHSNDEGRADAAGHGWAPCLDERLSQEVQDRLSAIDGIDGRGLDEDEWAFSPDCQDCVKTAKEYMVDGRGLRSAEWKKLCDLLGVKTPKRVTTESANRSELYGWRQDGEYGFVEVTKIEATVLEFPEAHVGRPRIRPEDLKEFGRSA